MNERRKLEERERSIVEELRSRRSTSQRQAGHATGDDSLEEEREDDGAFGDDRRELSVSERQAARATRRAS